ncbi:MAG: hypothetical protein AABY51_02060 [Deltaproteobacteria bacterium]
MFDGSKKITSVVIGHDSVLAVEVIKRGGRLSLGKTAKARLSDPRSSVACTNAFGELKRSCVLKGPVTLSVPDTFARILILEFAELPSKKAEALEVVTWKAAKQLYLRPEECRVDYQILPAEGSIKALVLLMKEKEIREIENALESSGIKAKKISTHSLDLINLLGSRSEPDSDASIILGMEGYITVMFLRSGLLDFYRCKELEGSVSDGISELTPAISYYNGRNPEFTPSRSYIFSDNQAFRDSAKGYLKGTAIKVCTDDYLIMEGAASLCKTDQTAILTALGAAF